MNRYAVFWFSVGSATKFDDFFPSYLSERRGTSTKTEVTYRLGMLADFWIIKLIQTGEVPLLFFYKITLLPGSDPASR